MIKFVFEAVHWVSFTADRNGAETFSGLKKALPPEYLTVTRAHDRSTELPGLCTGLSVSPTVFVPKNEINFLAHELNIRTAAG